MQIKILLLSLLICSCSNYIKLNKSVPANFEFEEAKPDTSCVDGKKIIEQTIHIWYPIDSCKNK
jgi:hypothetical protein